MNFKTFYKQQLVESGFFDYPLPQDLDGRRLFYYVTLDERGKTTRIKKAVNQTHQGMCDVFDEEASDMFETITGHVDYHKAIQCTLEIFWVAYDETSPITPERAAELFKHDLHHLKNVPGVWNVLSVNSEYTSTGEALFLATLEVDIATARQQQIQNNLKDVDTTGFEDLL